MRKIKFIFLLGLTILTTNAFSQQTQCVITGEVFNRESKTLLIRKYSESFRAFLNNPVKISIKEGKFSHTFSYNDVEASAIIFEDELDKGGWMPITFFPTDGIIEFRLYPQDKWNQNTIKGGEWNAEYESFKLSNKKIFETRRNELIAVQNVLRENDEFDSQEYKEVLRLMRAAKGNQDALVPIYTKMDEMEKTHACYTEKAKRQFVDPYDSLTKAELLWKYDYIKRNLSLVSYYLIWSDVEMQMKDKSLVAQLITDVFPLFAKKYPEHIYTKLVNTQVEGLRTIKTGNKYIDIKAPSVSGDTVQLSNVIQNRIALIDLWGSWCGPCIAKSRLIVPIYNKYKDKGFEVVGIAREFKTTDAVKRRIDKEQFTWLNLVDLDDKLNIWNQYGISNGTGLMVLVDKDGIILSIDPKPEEIEKILEQKLN
jgi:peroxiredoxin